jgi:hypothetical protein
MKITPLGGYLFPHCQLSFGGWHNSSADFNLKHNRVNTAQKQTNLDSSKSPSKNYRKIMSSYQYQYLCSTPYEEEKSPVILLKIFDSISSFRANKKYYNGYK